MESSRKIPYRSSCFLIGRLKMKGVRAFQDPLREQLGSLPDGAMFISSHLLSVLTSMK